jgi:hypothetical protein
MTCGTSPACRREERRKKLFGNPSWNGMDFLEVAGDQLSLCVHFFGGVPEGVTVDNVRIHGGRRIRDIKAVRVEIDRAHDAHLDDCLRITLDKAGDFSTYCLCLVEKVPAPVEIGSAAVAGADPDAGPSPGPLSGLDPRYACLDFSFKVDCPSDLDCKQETACPPDVLPAPEINYLAKDYASFRQLIFDRLAVTMPDWKERHVPDIGVTLVELLAYTGDHLSYYQDAVATEAYLDTARQRISIRRHARLVDYRLHEGNNARAWVTVWTRTDLPPLKPEDFYFITGFDGVQAASGHIVRAVDLEQVPQDRYDVFEPLVSDRDRPLVFRAAHSEIRFYTWGDNECCLVKGATRATLLDEVEGAPEPEEPPHEEPPPPPLPSAPHYNSASIQRRADLDLRTRQSSNPDDRILDLQPGDVLLFEEVLGPTTGVAADADPTRRWAVRLTKVTCSYDGLLDKQVVEIEWGAEDALPFSLCLSSRLPAPDCTWIRDVSVARGNVVLVDHGRTVGETFGPIGTKETPGECACDGAIIESRTVPERFQPVLQLAPLTFAQPLPARAPATRTIRQDVRLALPALTLTEYQPADQSDATGPQWVSQADLLSSGGDDRHFVVEMDDGGRGHLRFGDGELGRRPDAGTRVRAGYRIGNGPAGNVGRETITYLVVREGTVSTDDVQPRNPLPAQGGTVPEPVAEARLFAPHAFRSRRLRAITAEDYAELAQQDARLQRAACEIRWTGSWYEARVAVDPLERETPGRRLLAAIKAGLFPYRRMGHDLAVIPARYVPLDVALEVCVLPHTARGHVKAELLQLFDDRRLADGRLGFFHPDNLSFGDGIHLSRLVAAAKSVEGVETVKVTRLGRLHAFDDAALSSGVLGIDVMEIGQLDSDPNFPENGRLQLIMRGGR